MYGCFVLGGGGVSCWVFGPPQYQEAFTLLSNKGQNFRN
jgi:hypothetical protein